MGNSNRPGSVVIAEYDHDPVDVDGVEYVVRELKWNGDVGPTYDVVRTEDEYLLTEMDSFTHHPTTMEIRTLVVGDDCCWDERLRS